MSHTASRPPRTYVQQVIDDLAGRLPDCPPELIRLYALLALTRGPEADLEDVRDAWAIWRSSTDPHHRSLLPFDRLSPAVQELDRKYLEQVHEAAATYAWTVSPAGTSLP